MNNCDICDFCSVSAVFAIFIDFCDGGSEFLFRIILQFLQSICDIWNICNCMHFWTYLITADHTWKEGTNFDFPFNVAASSYKPGKLFRKHQLQGIANKQTTSEEVTVGVTGEEENEERSFEDLENDFADNDRGKASEEGAKTTTRTQNQGKKK